MEFIRIAQDMALPLVAVTLVAAFIGAVVWTNRRERKRKDANRALASHHGWDYWDEDSSLVTVASSEPFGYGRGRRALGVARGAYRRRGFVTFGYEYYTNSHSSDGTTSRTYRHFTVTAIAIGSILPTMRFTPEGWTDALATTFGGQDLEVESHEFNKRWRVRTEHERVAHAILAPDMIAHLLRPEYDDFPLIIENGLLYTFREGKQDLSDVEARLDPLVDMAAEIPEFVLAKYRRSANA